MTAIIGKILSVSFDPTSDGTSSPLITYEIISVNERSIATPIQYQLAGWQVDQPRVLRKLSSKRVGKWFSCEVRPADDGRYDVSVSGFFVFDPPERVKLDDEKMEVAFNEFRSLHAVGQGLADLAAHLWFHEEPVELIVVQLEGRETLTAPGEKSVRESPAGRKYLFLNDREDEREEE